MLLYLLEIDEQGLVKQLAITEGEIKDFENNPIFKAFTNQAEAEACMGKRWNGETWEAVAPTEAPPTVLEEEKVSLEERLKNLEQGQIATQEAIATMYEDHTKRNLQIDETLATIYETLTDKG